MGRPENLAAQRLVDRRISEIVALAQLAAWFPRSGYEARLANAVNEAVRDGIFDFNYEDITEEVMNGGTKKRFER